jgi:hypothetical protein
MPSHEILRPVALPPERGESNPSSNPEKRGRLFVLDTPDSAVELKVGREVEIDWEKKGKLGQLRKFVGLFRKLFKSRARRKRIEKNEGKLKKDIEGISNTEGWQGIIDREAKIETTTYYKRSPIRLNPQEEPVDAEILETLKEQLPPRYFRQIIRPSPLFTVDRDNYEDLRARNKIPPIPEIEKLIAIAEKGQTFMVRIQPLGS